MGLTANQRRLKNLACSRAWKKKNRKRVRDLTARWYREHKGQWLRTNRKWNKAHKKERRLSYRTWRLKHPKRIKDLRKKCLEKIQVFLKSLQREIGCQWFGGCKINDTRVLEWAHIVPRKSSPAISSITSWKKLWEELDKCMVLCANHHKLYDFEVKKK